MARERPKDVDVPGPGQESVWDYPRPPRIEPVSALVRVEIAGLVLGETRHALRVLETAGAPVYYLPADDVRRDCLEPSSHTTLCEWKGVARYWSVRREDRFEPDAAWDYPRPLEGFAEIAHHLAFYPGRMDACHVGDQRVTPQPGDFYGGWITPDLTGPFKGQPGSERW